MNQNILTFKTRTINLYLFKEAFAHFLVCLFILIFAILMIRIFKLTDLVVNKGFGLIDIMTFIGLLVPSFVTFVIPMSLLLGVLITLGRFSADGEIIALKASGISLAQIFKPIIILSFIAYLISTLFTIYLSPKANYSLEKFIFDLAQYRAEAGLKERVFNDDFEGLMLYVNEIPPQSTRLKGVLISDTRQTKEPTTIIAEEGYLITNLEERKVTLHLKNGSIHQLNQKTKKYQKIDFTTYNLNLSSQQASSNQGGFEKEKEEMSIPELLHSASSNRTNQKYFSFMVELHSRFAIPFACLIFGLLSVPLGVHNPRAGKSYGFIIGLIVMLVYYVLFSFGRNLGSIGRTHPFVSMWIPNVIFLFLAGYLFRKGEKESSIPVLEKCAWYYESLKNKVRFLVEGSRPEETDKVPILEVLNTASREGLMLNLGIGRKRASTIIAYREHHGEIKDLEELKRIRGIGEKTFEKIKGYLLS